MSGAISGRRPSAQNGGASAKLREETHVAGKADVHLSTGIVLYASEQCNMTVYFTQMSWFQPG